MSKERTELEKVIDRVDNSFDRSRRSIISVVLSIFLLAAAGAIAIGLAIDFAQLAALAARGGLIDTSINTLALAVATGALGLSLLTTAVTFDWEKQRRGIEHRQHYKKLKGCGFDSLTLHALIVMGSMLPKDITLKQALAANSELFTEREFARRLLE